ncbi:MAG TPA: hypothetical protein VIK78_14560 [Ruminiclostridium sp.]
MELSREYEMINKTSTGEIVIADMGRKGNVRVSVISESNPSASNRSTLLHFANLEELLSSYVFDYEWFKSTDYMVDYKEMNLRFYTEKSAYGKGSENRRCAK